MASGLLAMSRAAADDVFSDAHGGMIMDEPMSPGGADGSSSNPNSPDDFPQGRRAVSDTPSPGAEDDLLLSASVEQRKRLRMARINTDGLLSQSVPVNGMRMANPDNPLTGRSRGASFSKQQAGQPAAEPWLAAAAKGSGLDLDALLVLGSLSSATPRAVPEGRERAMTMPVKPMAASAGSSYEQTESRFARLSVRSSSPYAVERPRSGSVGRRKDVKHVVMPHSPASAGGGVEVKRTFHNERERLRRSTIRNLFEELRQQVPVLLSAEGTSDRQILVEAATHIDGLNAEGQAQEQELKQLRLQNIRLRLARSQAPAGSEERRQLEARMEELEAAIENGEPLPDFGAAPSFGSPSLERPENGVGRRRRSPNGPPSARRDPGIGLPGARGRNDLSALLSVASQELAGMPATTGFSILSASAPS